MLHLTINAQFGTEKSATQLCDKLFKRINRIAKPTQ